MKLVLWVLGFCCEGDELVYFILAVEIFRLHLVHSH